MVMFKEERKKVGEVDFNCPNCNRSLHRVLWAEATEWDCETGEPTCFDFINAFAFCPCGAKLAVVDDYENLLLLWINKKEMTAKESTTNLPFLG